MGVADVVLDNPILVKHLRSRLRPWQAMPMAVVIMVLGVFILYAGHTIPYFGETGAMKTLLGLQILILVFGGSNQINASLGGARESGVLDFHRVSPLPPSVVALGFFLGAPIREYMLAAVLGPFALACGVLLDRQGTWQDLVAVARLEVAVLMTTWVIHAVAVLGCLTRKKPRGSINGAIVTIVGLLFFLYFGSIGIYFGTQWLLDKDRAVNFFGVMIPWLPWLLINEVCALGFLGLAIARKMKAERAHSYTKLQALACMATLCVLLVGTLWNVGRLLPPLYNPSQEPTNCDIVMIASVYALTFAAMVLAVTVTPDAGEYVKGVRRAVREGRRRPSPWSDSGSNRVVLFALCVLVLGAATTVVNVVGREPPFDPNWYGVNSRFSVTPSLPARVSDGAWLASRQAFTSRPIVVGVLALASFGLALQYFSLRTRKSGPVLTTLFLFVTWLGPMLAGAIVGLSATDQERALIWLALSPLTGISLSSGLNTPPGVEMIRFAALAPPIAFAFIFNSLLVMTQRKVDRLIQTKVKALAADKPLETESP